jgi:hypothetical protein
MFERRLRAVVDIDEMQYGFIPGKRTVNALFVVSFLNGRVLLKRKD